MCDSIYVGILEIIRILPRAVIRPGTILSISQRDDLCLLRHVDVREYNTDTRASIIESIIKITATESKQEYLRRSRGNSRPIAAVW